MTTSKPEDGEATNAAEGAAPAADSSAPAATRGAKAARSEKTVRMTRDPEIYDAPHSADVHPDEVQNFRNGGWQIDGSDSATKG